MMELRFTAIQLSYIVAMTLFFVGLKELGSPATARKGNTLASVGMLIAIVATLLEKQVLNYGMIFIAIALGSVLGAIMAYKVEMTDMPQMVGLLNGFGGAASAMVAVGEFWRYLAIVQNPPLSTTITALLGVLIGGVTFTGSVMAFAKLQGLITGAPVVFPAQKILNGLLLGGFLVGSIYICLHPFNSQIFLGLLLISLILGVTFVLPIGGGDMPVVISLLNSFSGLAGSAAGFVVNNNLLIIAGALVGASGIILTVIMCKAMNRSLANVLFAGFGSGESAGGGAAGSTVEGTVKSIDTEEGAMMLGYARSVVIV
ncbi:MAG: NAD(P)(+) transhydrogenase (Re/Si-specific) subunit beta, partial [Microcoleaceae cyanobacterium]